MGLRFQRRIRIFKGLQLNLSKSGVGISAGVRGFHVGVDGKCRTYTSSSIPGTGISAREYVKHGTPSAGRGRIALTVLAVLFILWVLGTLGRHR